MKFFHRKLPYYQSIGWSLGGDDDDYGHRRGWAPLRRLKSWIPRLRSFSICRLLWIAILVSALVCLVIVLQKYVPRRLDPIPSSVFHPSQESLYSNAGLNHLNRVVFLTWTGTTPMRPVGLATIDSIARWLPQWKIEVHFTKEVGIPDDIYAIRKRNIEFQMNYFKERGVNITAIIHEDIEEELKGTMFDGLGVEQKHMGGIYKTKSAHSHGAHASDFLRIFLTLHSGGMYMDEDNIMLADLEPLFDHYGPTLLVSGEDNQTISHCKERWPQNCWYSQAPDHPFFIDNARRVKATIKQKGPDCLFHYDETEFHFGNCFWTIIGPRKFEAAHLFMCDVNPPELVNELPAHLVPSNNPKIQPSPQHRHRSIYPLFGGKHVLSGHWGEPDFLIDGGNDVIQRIHTLSTTYMFHIYGTLKYNILDYLRNATQYPVLNYLYKTSCLHLCNPKDYVLLNFSSDVSDLESLSSSSP